MDTWQSWAEFEANHPGMTTQAEFTVHSLRAASTIKLLTQHRASAVTEEDTRAVELLRACQDALTVLNIHREAADAARGYGTVSSASNDGYSETYASAADAAAARADEDRRAVSLYLSDPYTRWMLYKGGVYHAPARRWPPCR